MSKPKEILQTIETQLATITVANGYNNTVKKTSYGYIPRQAVTSVPTVCLMIGPSTFVPLTYEEYTSGAGRNSIDGWSITVVSYVQADVSEEALTNAIMDMSEDVAKAMLEDRTFGLSYVNNVYYKSFEYEADIEKSSAVIFQTFEVKYDFTKTAP